MVGSSFQKETEQKTNLFNIDQRLCWYVISILFSFLFKCPHFKNITFRRFNQLTILLLCSSFSNSASLCHITRRTFIASCLRPSTSWYCTYLCIEMSLFSARQRINKKENINGFSKKNR